MQDIGYPKVWARNLPRRPDFVVFCFWVLCIFSVFDNFDVFLSESRRLPRHTGLPCTLLDAHRKVNVDSMNFRLIYGTSGELRTKTFENMLDMPILDMWVVWDIVYLCEWLFEYFTRCGYCRRRFFCFSKKDDTRFVGHATFEKT